MERTPLRKKPLMPELRILKPLPITAHLADQLRTLDRKSKNKPGSALRSLFMSAETL